MNDATLIRASLEASSPRRERGTNLLRRAVLRRLTRLHAGSVTLREGGVVQHFGAGTPHAEITVNDPAFYADLALGGSVGAGESYMAGTWRSEDLTALVRLMVLNQDVLDDMEKGFARLTSPLRQFFHLLRRNSRAGSRRNIGAHYDIGDEFFELMLDDTMMYSCAIFETPESTLREAQLAKLERICRTLELGPGDRVLEIGAGWGGFALHAARHYGCHVTTTTISHNQYERTCTRVAAAGLADRVTVLCKDYRDLRGRYDKLVSIEMIEAVGHQYFDAFFRQCGRLLEPEGQMLLQAITIADQRYESAKHSVDFIRRYIFPGCTIPSLTALAQSMTRASDLRLFQLADIGSHYATTLSHWRRNLFANLAPVRALGYPESFVRMWEFYLCYCEGGFAERALGDVHMLLVKPRCRRAPAVMSAVPVERGIAAAGSAAA
jgi:cyclopropane-fatty-acyl-phospholipid synthase